MEEHPKINYKELKAKVGIDDVAFSLGYQLDRRAGMGRYIELVMPDGHGGKRDTIVISHPHEKAKQTYFHRSGALGRPGDVISFILENKHSFRVDSNGSDWDTVSKVLSKFANTPMPANKDSESIRLASRDTKFDPDSYETKPVGILQGITKTIFESRKITQETVNDFSPFIEMVRFSPTGKYFNIGFPYRQPGSTKTEGYEIRGLGGFKRKATGTNSSTAAWIADFSKGRQPSEIRNVFFAESAFDIMAMYQANKTKLINSGELEHTVFVSLGGTFSRGQISGIMNHYSNARAIDSFDNDLAGRVYSLRMADAVENLNLTIMQKGDNLVVKYKDKEHEINAARANVNDLRTFVKLERNYGTFKAPPAYKDWNDLIMGNPISSLPRQPTKYGRNDRLAELRNTNNEEKKVTSKLKR